ncbi:hypothetical protein H9Q69_007845 [Fusarium xylarioides]|nr:hypothetical protein H9Q69_007845 [Fusarium xylarioides]
MPLQSKKTVKVYDIAAGTSREQYLDFVEHLCTKPQKAPRFRLSRITKHFKGKSKLNPPTLTASADEAQEETTLKDEAQPIERGQSVSLADDSWMTANEKGPIGTSYCLQNGQQVGTISFETEIQKVEALARHKKDKKCSWHGWTIEDNFKEITTLYEAADAKVDICAVHGLGGNAIDTWTATNGKMWFRDFLPEDETFKSSRIMIFGYDSDLTDRSTVMELENWADTLLRSVNEVRTGDKAMTQLRLTSNYGNINLSQCGIVFLATPHSGSRKADWSNFLVATASTIGGVRPETVKILQAFNTASVWDTAAFLNLDPCPPFRCFAEGLKMRVKGTNQHIVTQASASLGKDQAHMIMDVDHSSICKFNSRLGALVTVTMALRELLNEVIAGGVQQPKAEPERRVSTHDEIDKPFFGRSKEMGKLEESLATDDKRPKLIVIKGIAGIGKTELLLQFAIKQREKRNVFFLGTDDGETIENVLSKLSTRIGFDMIECPADNQERWRNTPVAERIQVFFTWLGSTCNRDSLFIVDDIETFGYPKIPIILKYPAQCVLISTRDSNLIRTDRQFREFRLSPLGSQDTLEIINSTLTSMSLDPASWHGLEAIAHKVQGHPLAARNSIPFIVGHLSTCESPAAAFLDLFDSQYPEERKLFLEYSFEGRSLWETFNTSLERLELQKDPKRAKELLQILPFLSFDNDCVDALFKMDNRWLTEYEQELPDMMILKFGHKVISSWLLKLRGVSFYVSSESFSPVKPLNIHPLIWQYMLLHIDEGTRIGLMRQTLQFFFRLERTGVDRETQIKPHVLHCVQVCQGLGIDLNNLELQDQILQWLRGIIVMQELHDLEENPFRDPIELSFTAANDFVKTCMDTRDYLHQDSNAMIDEGIKHNMLENISDSLKGSLLEAVKVLRDLVKLRNIYPEVIYELEKFQDDLK